MIKLKREKIFDPEALNIVGASLLLPEGWTMEGRFEWMPLYTMQANLFLRVADPGTSAWMTMLPAQQFVYETQPMGFGQPGSNWLGSVLLPPPQDPVHAVGMLFMNGPLQHLRQAQVMAVNDMPSYGQAVQRGLLVAATAHATRLRYAFNWNGQGWEQDVYLTLVFGQPSMGIGMWWCVGSYSFGAPAGQLDRLTPMLSVPTLSVRLTQDWFSLLQQMQVLFAENIKRQQGRKGGQIWGMTDTPGVVWSRGAAQIREKFRPDWQRRQAALAQEQSALIQLIGGLETYADPFDSSPVQLPVGQGSYWMSAEGDVVGSDEQGFDPSARSGVEWRPMQRMGFAPQPHAQPAPPSPPPPPLPGWQ